MTDPDNAFAELMHDYVAECLPLAEQAADAFVELERRWAQGDAEFALGAGVKGVLHTVKGNSAMMGLVSIQSVAHALEDLCAVTGSGRPAQHEALSGLLVEGGGLLVDAIRGAAGGVRAGPLDALVARVRRFLQSGPSADRPVEERRHGERREGDERRTGAEGSMDTVRVDFRRLDGMLEILGEAMIAQSALRSAHLRLRARHGATPEVADLDGRIETLDKTMKRLTAALMETRLLPMSTVFGRFNRLVRDVAHPEHKQVRLVASGGETPIDKTVLDRIGEPLIHLLTNAVIHGVEPPDERTRAGKPPEATLGLRASLRSDRVVITVSDDGRGLATDKILAKARALGIEPPSTAPEDIYQLAFLPGLSTADAVSALAGRGVGLDVVAAGIHALGGRIAVDSAPGRGTAFVLSLPLTLAVLKALVIETEGERYALPLAHVVETVRVRPETIHEINRQGVALWRGELIPVSDAGALLGAASRGGRRAFYVVIHAGTGRRGILVDRLIGYQDVVVKGLDPALGKPPCIAGTTILGDGRVVCILDAAGLVQPRAVSAGAA